jgi:hypothetical protein
MTADLYERIHKDETIQTLLILWQANRNNCVGREAGDEVLSRLWLGKHGDKRVAVVEELPAG